MKPFKANNSKKFSEIRIIVGIEANKPLFLGVPSFSNEKYALE